MDRLNYLSRVKVLNNKKLIVIENGLVKGFFSSKVIDKNSFSDIECSVIKEILIDEYEAELKERISTKNKEITKIALYACLPENADFVLIAHKLQHSIVCIKNIVEIKNFCDHSRSDSILKIDFKRNEVVRKSFFPSIPINQWI